MGDVYQIIYWYNINPRILPILRVKLMIYYSKGKYCYIRTYPSLFPRRISNRDNRSFIYQFGTKSFQINLFATSNYLICENRFLSSHRSDNNSMFFLYTAYIVMCILHVMSQFVIIALCCNTCPNLEYILPQFVIAALFCNKGTVSHPPSHVTLGHVIKWYAKKSFISTFARAQFFTIQGSFLLIYKQELKCGKVSSLFFEVD